MLFLKVFPIVLMGPITEKKLCESEIFHQIFEGFHNSDAFFIFCFFDGFPNSTD